MPSQLFTAVTPAGTDRIWKNSVGLTGIEFLSAAAFLFLFSNEFLILFLYMKLYNWKHDVNQLTLVAYTSAFQTYLQCDAQAPGRKWWWHDNVMASLPLLGWETKHDRLSSSKKLRVGRRFQACEKSSMHRSSTKQVKSVNYYCL